MSTKPSLATKLSKSALRAIPKKGERIETVYEYTDLDVLLGRGNGFAQSKGNLRFRAIVNKYRKSYNECVNIREKRIWALKVYNDVTQSGGRFLEVERKSRTGDRSGVFRTTTMEKALEKCAQTLRERKWRPTPPITVEEFDQEKATTNQEVIQESREEEEREHRTSPVEEQEHCPKNLVEAVHSIPSLPTGETQEFLSGNAAHVEPAHKTSRESHSLRFRLPLARKREHKIPARSSKHPASPRCDNSEEELSKPEAVLPSDATPKESLLDACETVTPTKSLSRGALRNNEMLAWNDNTLQSTESRTCSPTSSVPEDGGTDEGSSAASISTQESQTCTGVKWDLPEEETVSIVEAAKMTPELPCVDAKPPRKPGKTKISLKGASKAAGTKKKKEANSTKAVTPEADEKSFVTELTDRDVLFGRGTSINNHPGNVRFRELCIPFRAEYAALEAPEKRPFALTIVAKCEGRFLEADPHDPRKYRYVSVARCLEKVCQALRDKSWNKWDKLASQSKKACEKHPTKTTKKRMSVGKDELPQPSKKPKPTPTQVPHGVSKEVPPISSGSKSDAAHLVKKGSRIEVYWPMDDKFYEAKVEDSKISGKPPVHKFFIRYVMDNEIEWIDLTQHVFRILDPEPPQSTSNETHPTEKTVPSNDDIKVKTFRVTGEVPRQTGRRNLFWTTGCQKKTDGVFPTGGTILF